VLLWGAQGGGVPRTVEGMFDAFSTSVRQASTVPHLLPQVCQHLASLCVCGFRVLSL